MKVFLATISCLMSLAYAGETFSGSGFMRCYGDMSISLRIDGEGLLDCQPAWGSPAAPPQGIIADGDDGSHWVTVDDKAEVVTEPSSTRPETWDLDIATDWPWMMDTRLDCSVGTPIVLGIWRLNAPC